MEAAVDAIIVIDHHGRIQAVNDATCRMFGYVTDELLGANVRVLMPEPDRSAHDGYLAKHLSTGEAKVIGIGRQVTAQRSDGALFPAYLSVGRVPQSMPPRFVGFVRDITREVEATNAEVTDRSRRAADALLAQQRLTRVARLATMGELASGMAHEINQPLTAITTYARACERYLAMPQPDLAEVREATREIAAEGLRAGAIIGRLRKLVRIDDDEERTRVDINALVDELRAMLAADARLYEARLHIALTPDLPRVRAHAAQLQQVVLNLVRNAFEALLDDPVGAREVELSTLRLDNGNIELRVADNGPGISSAIEGRLFDPFATTKLAGTGLGLSISRTIVQSHGGTIGLRAATARGATFSVQLPSEEDEPS
ncbi:MAG: PAS domain S-box protein [Steroidobacteraceae bacterium]|nr:PAS domain S-box protein [Steroidobacteraceae bacterium]